MELFWAAKIEGGICFLDKEESTHCVKVLRHVVGDEISVIDGLGTMFRCSLSEASASGAQAHILEEFPGWGAHQYRLQLAVCPTKNNDRYEWFAEKATELSVDVISPVIGERSERRIFKTDRLRKIVLSATKQSLKSAIPVIEEPVSVKQFIAHSAASPALKLIAYCFEGSTKRVSIKDVLQSHGASDVIVMIGPEGDFSPAEAQAAIEAGFIPIHLGNSRLRTETAAVTAAEALYLANM